MKHPLLTTIAAVVLVGCGEMQQSDSASESIPVLPDAQAAKASRLTKEVHGYELSASEIEAISSKPHDPSWTVPKLSRLAFRPGSWERSNNKGTKQFKKIKHVGGRYVVIETSSTSNGPKISTEIHSFDPTSNTMYSNFLIHQTGEVSRATGAVNIEERRINWTSQLNSNTEEKRRLDLTVTFDNDGLSATLVGKGSLNDIPVLLINDRLNWIGGQISSANTAARRVLN